MTGLTGYLRGHHGDTKKKTFSHLNGEVSVRYAGHTKLYSLAKKQDSNWTSLSCLLNLRFGAARWSRKGYTETDPLGQL